LFEWWNILWGWFLGLGNELKVTIIVSIFAGIGGSIFGISKAIAWKIGSGNSPAPQSQDVPTSAVDKLLAGQQDRHDKNLNKLHKKLAKLKTASAGEQNSLKAEIAELQRREANPDAALEDAQKLIESLKAALAREGNAEAGDDLDKATQALNDGDTEAAQKFFQTIKDNKALDVQASARASFALGEIAEQDVRWGDAFTHYQEASRLKPCFAHLIRAQKMALHLANYPAAESLGQDALTCAEQEFGKESEQYGNCLNDLALLLMVTGKFTEAEPLMRQAIKVAQKTLGEGNPNYGATLNSLAQLLKSTGRFEEAEPLYRQALEIMRQTLGEDHPDFATSLNNLAGLLESTGRLEKAEPLYRQALEIMRQTLGEDHPDFATSLNNLAGLLENTGRFEEAEPMYRQALENAQLALGEKHRAMTDFG